MPIHSSYMLRSRIASHNLSYVINNISNLDLRFDENEHLISSVLRVSHGSQGVYQCAKSSILDHLVSGSNVKAV